MAHPLPLVTLFVAALLLAGCMADEQPEVEVPVDVETCAADGVCAAPPVLDGSGRDLRTQLSADDVLDVPTWRLGDIFQQHLFYGNRDTLGEHIFTMVVDTAGDCYTVATTSKKAASTEAVFDMPVLGCIGKGDLQTTAFDTAWDWMYDFPLQDGKSWNGNLNGLLNWNTNTFHDFSFTLTATYQERINTPNGDFPGFVIQGVTDDGLTLLDYNYVPAIGWFSHFWMYDITNDIPDDPSDIMFHAMSMGTATNYTGPYYLDTAENVVMDFLLVPFSVVDGLPTGPLFTVPDGATYLRGVIVPIACPGTSKVVVVTPENKPEEYDHTYEGDPQACPEADLSTTGLYTVHWVDRPAIAGEWRYSVAGAGMYGYYIEIDAVTEVQYELGPA